MAGRVLFRSIYGYGRGRAPICIYVQTHRRSIETGVQMKCYLCSHIHFASNDSILKALSQEMCPR